MRARFRLVSSCIVLCLAGQWLPATVDFLQNGAAPRSAVVQTSGTVADTKPENSASTALAPAGTTPTEAVGATQACLANLAGGRPALACDIRVLRPGS